MKQYRKGAACLLLISILFLLCSCKQNPSQEQLYSKLFAAFQDAGYACSLQDSAPDTPVGLYNASVWKQLDVDGETVLVYFDESNRADYLATMIDPEAYPTVIHFGQRFILTYQGSDEALIETLQGMNGSL